MAVFESSGRSSHLSHLARNLHKMCTKIVYINNCLENFHFANWALLVGWWLGEPSREAARLHKSPLNALYVCRHLSRRVACSRRQFIMHQTMALIRWNAQHEALATSHRQPSTRHFPRHLVPKRRKFQFSSLVCFHCLLRNLKLNDFEQCFLAR